MVYAAGWCAWLLLCSALAVPAQVCDLVLRGGRVIDGTGNPAYFADIGIKNGRIAAIGKLKDAPRQIDCRGLVITPGFIDVHTHAEDIDDLPLAENFVRMGVTTVVSGNCGTSPLPVERFLQRLESNKVSINFATLVGHGTVRKAAMGGNFNRPPTAAELARMKDLVARAMDEGALGLSTGLIYSPGEFAQTGEIIELAKIVAERNGIYASHMRGEGTNIFNSLAELFDVAREGGVRSHVSHIKLAGPAVWGQADKVLALIEKARAEGLDITQDQYLYTASSTSMAQLIPDDFKPGGAFAKRWDEPEVQANLAAAMKAGLAGGKRPDYAYAVIANYKHDPSLNGLNIAEAAAKVHGTKSLDDQIRLVIDIQKNGGATGIFHGMDETDLRTFLQHPNTMIASDSGVRRFGSGVPHPRGYGNNARVLAHYVRELKLLRLEDAVRRMTSLPATVFGLKDRGCLREGAWADIVVFDPETVRENSTFKDPHHYATGFAYVFVNGTIVVQHDKHTRLEDTRLKPGQAIRRASAADANEKR